MKIRSTFPQVYRLTDSKTGNSYFLVSARSKKWGLNERKAFSTEAEAIRHAKEIEQLIQREGKQDLKLTTDQQRKIDEYDDLAKRLLPYCRTLTQAVDHFVDFLGDQMLKKAKPSITQLVDGWQKWKKTDSTLSKATLHEVNFYGSFIIKTWGSNKPDDLKKKEIELTLRNLSVSNNSRRKFLTYVRQFLKWVKDEGHLTSNPTDGIKFRSDKFEARCYDSQQIKSLLKFVWENERDLIGYYALLTFAGLRPTEGQRVQWSDINFKTNELYVRPGKTQSRHIKLEQTAIEWLKLHHETNKDEFVKITNLFNREKRVRATMQEWIPDGLRHGFGTYFRSKTKDLLLTAETMGNSVSIVKKHYARTVPIEECESFWSMIPDTTLKS